MATPGSDAVHHRCGQADGAGLGRGAARGAAPDLILPGRQQLERPAGPCCPQRLVLRQGQWLPPLKAPALGSRCSVPARGRASLSRNKHHMGCALFSCRVSVKPALNPFPEGLPGICLQGHGDPVGGQIENRTQRGQRGQPLRAKTGA